MTPDELAREIAVADDPQLSWFFEHRKLVLLADVARVNARPDLQERIQAVFDHAVDQSAALRRDSATLQKMREIVERWDTTRAPATHAPVAFAELKRALEMARDA